MDSFGPRTCMTPSQTVKNAPATTSQTTMRGRVVPATSTE